MRTWVRCLTVVISGILSSNTQATAEHLTCRGTVKFGSLDSAIGDCGFITDSAVGKAILGLCSGGSRCIVDAEVTRDFIDRVFAVRLEEPSQNEVNPVKISGFRMPSNQIHCMIVTNEGNSEPNGINCEINQTFVRTPVRPRPPDCEYDWGHSFELGNDSNADLACVSDSVRSDDSPVLTYGSSIKAGKIVCSSEESGLTCKNARGHGFFLSRRGQKIF